MRDYTENAYVVQTLDTTKLRTELGFVPQYDMKTGLSHTVQVLREIM